LEAGALDAGLRAVVALPVAALRAAGFFAGVTALRSRAGAARTLATMPLAASGTCAASIA
jgi:hypothetical protein